MNFIKLINYCTVECGIIKDAPKEEEMPQESVTLPSLQSEEMGTLDKMDEALAVKMQSTLFYTVLHVLLITCNLLTIFVLTALQ